MNENAWKSALIRGKIRWNRSSTVIGVRKLETGLSYVIKTLEVCLQQASTSIRNTELSLNCFRQ